MENEIPKIGECKSDHPKHIFIGIDPIDKPSRYSMDILSVAVIPKDKMNETITNIDTKRAGIIGEYLYTW